MKFKKLTSLLLAGSMLMTLTACGGDTTSSNASAESQGSGASASDESYTGPEYAFQLGHVGAEGSIEDEVTNLFKEMVEEKSGGKITIEIFGNSQMGGLSDLVDAVRYDTLDLAVFGLGNAESLFPKGGA